MSSVTNEAYNADGDLISRERTSYNYDSKSFRVESINETGTTRSENLEDEVWNLASRISYLAAHSNHTGYAQTIRETTVDATTGEKTIIDYAFGHDEILQRTRVFASGATLPTSDSSLVFGHDGHGSVRVLYDIAGAAARIAQAFTFAAYGEMIAIHNGQAVFSPLATRLSQLGFSGEHFDAKAMQQYLRARFYNPANGRFNRLDPFAGNMQDPQSLHKYAYVHGDPVNGVDPSGRSALFWLFGAARSIATGTPLLQVSASPANRIKNIRAETGATGSIDPSRSDKLATGSFQFFFAVGEPLAALQRVTNEGTLEVRLTSGREIKMTYDEQYLEAFANPGKAIADINRITDNHQQRPPGRALEKLLGGNFFTTPGNIYDLFYKDRNGNIELVEFWKWKAEVDFELVFAPAPSMKFGGKAHRSIKDTIVIDDSVFGRKTHNQHISSISHIGANNPNLRFPSGGKILKAKDKYESSTYGTSDTSVTITKVHGKYQ